MTELTWEGKYDENGRKVAPGVQRARLQNQILSDIVLP